MVPGNESKIHVAMDGVQVGNTNAIQGVSDDITYNLWARKEPAYVMKIWVTGGNS